MSEHVFLKNLTDDEKNAKIAALPDWQKRKMVANRFPGTFVGECGSFDRRIDVGGLGFEVDSRHLFVHNSPGMERQRVFTHKAIVRTDTNDPIGVVGASYGVVSNAAFLSGLKSLHEQGHASLENAWCEFGGGRVGAASLIGNSSFGARLGGDKPETFAHYIVARSSHDGSGSVNYSLFSVQMVCLNGWTSTTREHHVSVRHTKNAALYVEGASYALDRLVVDAIEQQKKLEWLAQEQYSLEQFHELVTDTLTAERGEADTERKQTRRAKDIADLEEFFRHGDGNFGQSKLDAMSAITQWLTPRRESYADAAKFARKFAGNETGAAARTRQRVLETLTS